MSGANKGAKVGTLWLDAVKLAFASESTTSATDTTADDSRQLERNFDALDFSSNVSILAHLFSNVINPEPHINSRGRLCLPDTYSVKMNTCNRALFHALLEPVVFFSAPQKFQRSLLDLLTAVFKRSVYNAVRFQCGDAPFKASSAEATSPADNNNSNTNISSRSCSSSAGSTDYFLFSLLLALLQHGIRKQQQQQQQQLRNKSSAAVAAATHVAVLKRVIHLLGIVGLAGVNVADFRSYLTLLRSTSPLSLPLLQGLRVMLGQDKLIAKAAPNFLFNFGGRGSGLITFPSSVPFAREFQICLWFRVENFEHAASNSSNNYRDSSSSNNYSSSSSSSGGDASVAFDDSNKSTQHIISWQSAAQKGLDVFIDRSGVLTIAVGTANSNSSNNSNGSSGSNSSSGGKQSDGMVLLPLRDFSLRRGVWFHLCVKHSKPRLSLFTNDELSVFIDQQLVFQDNVRFPSFTNSSSNNSSSSSSNSQSEVQFAVGRNFDGQMSPVYLFSEPLPPSAVEVIAKLDACRAVDGVTDAVAAATAASSSSSSSSRSSSSGGVNVSSQQLLLVDMLPSIPATSERSSSKGATVAVSSKLAMSFHPARVACGLALDVFGGRHALLLRCTQQWMLRGAMDVLDSIGGLCCLLPLFPRLLVEREDEETAAAEEKEREERMGAAGTPTTTTATTVGRQRSSNSGAVSALSAVSDDGADLADDVSTSSCCYSPLQSQSYGLADVHPAAAAAEHDDCAELDSNVLHSLRADREEFAGEGLVSLLLLILAKCLAGNRKYQLEAVREGCVEMIAYSLQYVPQEVLLMESEKCVVSLMALQKAAADNTLLEYKITKSLLCNFSLWSRASFELISSLLSVLLAAVRAQPRIYAKLLGVKFVLDSLEYFTAVDAGGDYYAYDPIADDSSSSRQGAVPFITDTATTTATAAGVTAGVAATTIPPSADVVAAATYDDAVKQSDTAIETTATAEDVDNIASAVQQQQQIHDHSADVLSIDSEVSVADAVANDKANTATDTTAAATAAAVGDDDGEAVIVSPVEEESKQESNLRKHRSLPPSLLTDIQIAARADSANSSSNTAVPVGAHTASSVLLLKSKQQQQQQQHRKLRRTTHSKHISGSQNVKRYTSFIRAVTDTIEDDSGMLMMTHRGESNGDDNNSNSNSSAASNATTAVYSAFTPPVTPANSNNNCAVNVSPSAAKRRSFRGSSASGGLLAAAATATAGVAATEALVDATNNRQLPTTAEETIESMQLPEPPLINTIAAAAMDESSALRSESEDTNCELQQQEQVYLSQQQQQQQQQYSLSNEHRKHLRDCMESMVVTLLQSAVTDSEIHPLLDFMTVCRDRVVLNEIATIVLFMIVADGGGHRFTTALISACSGTEEFASFVLLYLVHQPYESLRCTGIRILTHFYLRIDSLPLSATSLTLRRKKGLLSRAVGSISALTHGHGLKRLQLCGGLALLCEIISCHCNASSELTYAALLELLLTKPGMQSQVTLRYSDIFTPQHAAALADASRSNSSSNNNTSTLSSTTTAAAGGGGVYQQGSVGQRAVVFAAAFISPDQVHDNEGVDMMNSLVLPIFFELIPQLPISAQGQVYSDFLALLKHGAGNRDAFISAPSWHLCMYGLVSQLVSALTDDCHSVRMFNTVTLLAELEHWAVHFHDNSSSNNNSVGSSSSGVGQSPLRVSLERRLRSHPQQQQQQQQQKPQGELLRAWRNTDATATTTTISYHDNNNNGNSSSSSAFGKLNRRRSSGGVSTTSLGSCSSHDLLSVGSSDHCSTATATTTTAAAADAAAADAKSAQAEQDLWFALGMKIYATLLLHAIEFKGGWKEIDRSISYSYDSDLGYSVAQTILSHVLNDLTFSMRSRYKEIQRLAKSTAAHENVEAMDRLENFLCLLLTTSQLALVDQHCAVNAVKNFHLCKLRVQYFDELMRDHAKQQQQQKLSSAAVDHSSSNNSNSSCNNSSNNSNNNSSSSSNSIGLDIELNDMRAIIEQTELKLAARLQQNESSSDKSDNSSSSMAGSATDYSQQQQKQQQQQEEEQRGARGGTTLGNIDAEDQKNAQHSDYYDKHIDFYHLWQDITLLSPAEVAAAAATASEGASSSPGAGNSSYDPLFSSMRSPIPVNNSSNSSSSSARAHSNVYKSVEELLHPLERNHDAAHGKLVLVLQTLRFFDIIFWPVAAGPLRNIEMLRFHKENINGLEGDSTSSTAATSSSNASSSTAAGVGVSTGSYPMTMYSAVMRLGLFVLHRLSPITHLAILNMKRLRALLAALDNITLYKTPTHDWLLAAVLHATVALQRLSLVLEPVFTALLGFSSSSAVLVPTVGPWSDSYDCNTLQSDEAAAFEAAMSDSNVLARVEAYFGSSPARNLLRNIRASLLLLATAFELHGDKLSSAMEERSYRSLCLLVEHFKASFTTPTAAATAAVGASDLSAAAATESAAAGGGKEGPYLTPSAADAAATPLLRRQSSGRVSFSDTSDSQLQQQQQQRRSNSSEADTHSINVNATAIQSSAAAASPYSRRNPLSALLGSSNSSSSTGGHSPIKNVIDVPSEANQPPPRSPSVRLAALARSSSNAFSARSDSCDFSDASDHDSSGSNVTGSNTSSAVSTAATAAAAAATPSQQQTAASTDAAATTNGSRCSGRSLSAAEIESLPERFEAADILQLLRWLRHPYLRLNAYRNIGVLKAIDALDFLEARAVNRFAKDADVLMQGLENQRDLALKSVEEMAELKELSLNVFDLMSSRYDNSSSSARTAELLNQKKIAAAWHERLGEFEADWSPWSTAAARAATATAVEESIGSSNSSSSVAERVRGVAYEELSRHRDRSLRRMLLRKLPDCIDHRDAAYLEGKIRDQELFQAAKLKIKPNEDPNVASRSAVDDFHTADDNTAATTSARSESVDIGNNNNNNSSINSNSGSTSMRMPFRGMRAAFLGGSSSQQQQHQRDSIGGSSGGVINSSGSSAMLDDECDELADDSSSSALAGSSSGSSGVSGDVTAAFTNFMYGSGKRPQWTLLFQWSADEKVLFTAQEAQQITLEQVVEGAVVLTNRCLYFHGRRRTGGLAVTQQPFVDQRWHLDRLCEFYGRRYLLQHCAIELFFVGCCELFLAFKSTATLHKFFRVLRRQTLPLLQSAAKASLSAATAFSSAPWTELWRRRLISNFEYLMRLNVLAGRSFNDITQYPVFPWVIADYTSPLLDLRDPRTFRRLDLPMGALNPSRLVDFLDRYRSFDDEMVPKFMYGSHYSSAGVVLHYLLRQEPFTSLAINLQGGRFDCPDRVFFDLQRTWQNCNESMSDVKEQLPELYCCPEVLLNTNRLPLGQLQDGSSGITTSSSTGSNDSNGSKGNSNNTAAAAAVVDDVRLPPWANGSAFEFIRLQRQALESDYVSEHLPSWIDLIFGCKQRGQAAVDAHNVFYYLTYENAVDLDSIEDPLQREAAKSQVTHFGQTPSQLLFKPHVKRLPREECSLPLCCEMQQQSSSPLQSPQQQQQYQQQQQQQSPLHSIRRFTPPRQQGALAQHGAVIAVSCGSERLVVLHADLTLAFYKWSSFPDDDRHPFTLRADRMKSLPSSCLSTALPLLKGREIVARQCMSAAAAAAAGINSTTTAATTATAATGSGGGSESIRMGLFRSFNKALNFSNSSDVQQQQQQQQLQQTSALRAAGSISHSIASDSSSSSSAGSSSNGGCSRSNSSSSGNDSSSSNSSSSSSVQYRLSHQHVALRSGEVGAGRVFSCQYWDQSLKAHSIDSLREIGSSRHSCHLGQITCLQQGAATAAAGAGVDAAHLLVTGGEDGTCRVWIFEKPTLAAALTRSAYFSPGDADNELLMQHALAAGDSNNVAASSVLQTSGGFSSSSSSGSSRPTSLVTSAVTGSSSSGSSSSSTAPLHCVHVLWGHSHPVRCISYSSELGLLLSADVAGVVCLHDVHSGSYLRTIAGIASMYTPSSYCSSSNNSSGSSSGNSSSNGSSPSNSNSTSNSSGSGSGSMSVDVVYCSSSGYLVTHSWTAPDMRTNLYWTNGQLLLSTALSHRVECMTGSSDGLVLICGGADGLLLFREIWSLKEIHRLDMHAHGPIRCLAFTDDFQYLFAGSEDGSFSVVTDPDARWRIFNAALQKTPLLGTAAL